MAQRAFRAGVAVVAGAVLVVACAKVPFTGRLQYNLIPTSLMNAIGKASYAGSIGGSHVEKRGPNSEALQRVGKRISKVANEPKYNWEFSMIDENTVNAWCLPGGYIGFYTGILPALRNESGMAFVMGHEVGHATAHHGAERLSQQLTLLGGLAGLGVYLDRGADLKPEQTAIILGALGVGTELAVMLPFSRSHEAEADVIGIMYAASAGYPPEESIPLWDRMAELSGPSSLPAFLSTHPSNEKRQENLREWMPQARKRYQRNALAGDMKTVLWEGVDVGGGKKRKGKAAAADTSGTETEGAPTKKGSTGGSTGGGGGGSTGGTRPK